MSRSNLVGAAAGARWLYGSALLLQLAIVAAGPTMAPVSAHADQGTQSASLNKFIEGKSAFEAGQFEEALVAFKASLELQASPNTRLYIARCHRALGQVASAYTQYKLSAREAQDRLTASGEKRYSATRDAAASEAAEIEGKVPRLTVVVPSDPPAGFRVTVSGAELQRAAWGVAVETDPGTLDVVAHGARSKPFHERVTLAEGEQKRVEVRLERLPTARLLLRFGTRPAGLSVTLDGDAVEPGSLDRAREVDVGRHTLVVRAPGYLPFRWSQELSDRQDAAVRIRLRADARATGSSGTPRWIFYGVAGASVVAVGAGTYLAIDAKSKSDDEQAKDPLERDSAVRDDIKSQSTTANILFVAGGMLAVGAGVLAFTTDWGTSGAEKGSVALTPLVGPSGAGAGAWGRF